MGPAPAAATFTARLAADLSLALMGQGLFAPARPEYKQALGALSDGLTRRLRDAGQIALLAGPPASPAAFCGCGFTAQRHSLDELLPAELNATLPRYLAGSWRDRRLVLLSLRNGMPRQEFDLLFQMLAVAGDRGPALLRKRFVEEHLRGNFGHVTLLFSDDLPPLHPDLPWPVQVALAWLARDLNWLSRMTGVPSAVVKTRRHALLDAVLDLAGGLGEQRDLLAYLNLIVEELGDYDRDEFAALLLGRLDQDRLAALCLELCALLERLQQRLERSSDADTREQIEAVRWIARRCAELLIEKGGVTPAHYHALVLQKVMLYEEIPGAFRPRVAALQVLTSFLANPQRCFAEIEGSHSPEVLQTRLWRLLEMLPNMLRAGRFDVLRDVVVFAQRFGPTFELSQKPELLALVRETAAEVLAAGDPALQAELMKTLPHIGRSGVHLLIDLADHPQRPVRRVALDGLVAAGPAVVPVLLESLARKSGWHHLRNVLVILGKVGAGGPKVEGLFRQGLEHPEAGVRKEALPGLARLLRESAAGLVAERLTDPDPEVRRWAVTCLGLTGVPAAAVYDRLADFLAARSSNEMALAVVATLNRLRPGIIAGKRVEAELVALAGGGGWFGQGKGASDRTLRLEAIRALGQFSGERVCKSLERLEKDSDAGVASAAREALQGGKGRGVS